MKEDSVLPRNPTDVRDRLYGADLVVGMHDRDQDGCRRHRASHIIGVDAAESINRHVGDLRPQPFKKSARADDGRVLNLGGDDVRMLDACCEEGPLYRVIVRFASTTCENHFACVTSEECCNLCSCGLHCCPRGRPRPVVA
jgi:hypothetical protein